MPIVLSIKADALRYVELWSVILSPSLKYPLDSNPPHEDMQFTIRSVFFVLLAVFSATMALPVLTSRDVFDPPITYPTAGSIFEAGETITVRWDTSSLPQGLPNKGLLVLGMLSQGSENLQLDHPLAQDFLLTDGHKQITFPKNLTTGSDYIIDLFGDSGNISQQFTIYAS